MIEVFIVAAKRTPFGNFCGKLKNFTATKLGSIVSESVLKDLPDRKQINSVIFGNVLQTSSNAAYLARHVALLSSLPEHVPAVTVNRLCGSGFESVVGAAQEILLGRSAAVLAGGVENMSQAPFVLRNIRNGIKFKFGAGVQLEDSLTTGLFDEYANMTMGATAENIAKKYNISREDCDIFAHKSHTRSISAWNAGIFDKEVIPIETEIRNKKENFLRDEGIRDDTTAVKLAALKPVFESDGRVTAGNSSGISDGAAALIIASKKSTEAMGVKPMAQIVDWQVCGVSPSYMGLGPVEAIRGILNRQKLSLQDIHHVEINEAFAAQILGVCKELGLHIQDNSHPDSHRVNPHGGAISLGHPLAASGSRILCTLSHGLVNGNHEYALGAACIGGGQGIAVLLKKVR